MPNSLSRAIVESLRRGEMSRDFSKMLLSANRSKAAISNETVYWDYKEIIDLSNPYDIAELAKDVLAFHNTKGGAVIFGITNDYKVKGMYENTITDTVGLLNKLRRYIGPDVPLFQDRIITRKSLYVWVVFVAKRLGVPVAARTNGPQKNNGKYALVKGDYFIRINDETRLCRDPIDLQLFFEGFSVDHLHAYTYEVDEPYFRLLSPHCDRFFGRQELLNTIFDRLNSRHHIVVLDGMGGVGKSEVAIEAFRKLYKTNSYSFMISLSAKNAVWSGKKSGRKAGFAGFVEFIEELGKVLCLPINEEDIDQTKEAIIECISGEKGLLIVDNIEDVSDDKLMRFLSLELPDPVRVLVTSRIKKNIGGITVSVQEMFPEEARQLLTWELELVGYSNYLSEEEHLDSIITATGRLPLALKWAASLAKKYNSLKEVSRIIRTQGGAKQELLTFCFETMFNSLSDEAQKVAMLAHHLGKDWNDITNHMILGSSKYDVQKAVQELQDRGLIFASTAGNFDHKSFLPLTLDYLKDSWNADINFKRFVKRRLSELFTLPNEEGLLMHWPNYKRRVALLEKANQLMAVHDYENALNMIDLARMNDENDFEVVFTHGKILFEMGKQYPGM